jgi:type II secretory pathway predicted ATPase ExeA
MKEKNNWKTVDITLTESEFNIIAREAHEKDITFNERANQILQECIDRLENDPAFKKDFKTLIKKQKLEEAHNTRSRPISKFIDDSRTTEQRPSEAKNKRLANVQDRISKRSSTCMSVLQKAKSKD